MRSVHYQDHDRPTALHAERMPWIRRGQQLWFYRIAVTDGNHDYVVEFKDNGEAAVFRFDNLGLRPCQAPKIARVAREAIHV